MIEQTTSFIYTVDDVRDYIRTHPHRSDIWTQPIVDYLKTFQALHPLDSLVDVRLTEGYLLRVHHYAPNAYYCTLKTVEDVLIYARIVYPFYNPPVTQCPNRA